MAQTKGSNDDEARGGNNRSQLAAAKGGMKSFSDPVDIAQGRGSILDDKENFGTSRAYENRSTKANEINRQVHFTRKQEAAVRIGYREALRSGRGDRALALLGEAEAKGVNPFGIRKHGADERAATAKIDSRKRVMDRVEAKENRQDRRAGIDQGGNQGGNQGGGDSRKGHQADPQTGEAPQTGEELRGGLIGLLNEMGIEGDNFQETTPGELGPDQLARRTKLRQRLAGFAGLLSPNNPDLDRDRAALQKGADELGVGSQMDVLEKRAGTFKAVSGGSGGPAAPTQPQANGTPFVPFSAKTHEMDVNEGGGRPGEVSQAQQNKFMSNVSKSYSGPERAAFKGIQNHLQNAVNAGKIGTRYAAQYQSDLVDVFNRYSSMKRFKLDEGVSKPPTEKELKKSPEALNNWIAEVQEQYSQIQTEQRDSER